jgi:hypothetical protein
MQNGNGEMRRLPSQLLIKRYETISTNTHMHAASSPDVLLLLLLLLVIE